MKQTSLYLTTVLIWGSTWIAIKYQLGVVDPMVSVVYRFALAAFLLLLFCKIRGLSLSFSPKAHFFMALVGICLFSMNYWLVYLSEIYLTSGLVAVLFSSMVFFNMANNAIFLKAAVDKKTILGAVLGIAGIGLIFMPEIRAFDIQDNGVAGILLGLSAVLLSSFGNIASARNTRNQIPLVQANAIGMAYGTLALGILALILGKEFSFSFSPAYAGSLVFLALFGSVVAFGTYLTLVGTMGADKAAYAIMVVPVVALGISSLVEGYAWTLPGLFGLLLVVGGNFLALAPQVRFGRQRAGQNR